MMLAINGVLYSDEDMIVKKAQFERMNENVKDITNICLYSGLAYAIATGVIGTVFLGEIIAVTIINKSVRYGLKKSGVGDKLYKMIKREKVVEVNV